MTWDMTRADVMRSLCSLPLAVRVAVPVAAAFRTGAALAVIGQPRMPALTGPYESIGVQIVEVPGCCRAKVFYPCEPVVGLEEAPYCTDGRQSSDSMAGLVGFKQLGLSFLLAHLADAWSGCLKDAPPISQGTALPLLVYSHGFGGNMDMGSYLMREIASQGVVVAALEHRDGTASFTRAADGSEMPFAPNRLSSIEQLRCRVRDLLAAAKPGALGTRLPALDATRVCLGGHSYGGPAALLAAAMAPSTARPAGVLLHDPALGMGSSELSRVACRGGSLECPVLSFTSDEYDRAGVVCGTTYHIDGCFHGNFVDAALWAPPWVMRPLSAVVPAAGPMEPAAVHAVLARTAARFLKMREGDADNELRWMAQGEPSLQPRQYV